MGCKNFGIEKYAIPTPVNISKRTKNDKLKVKFFKKLILIGCL